jgi:hypothetical protein
MPVEGADSARRYGRAADTVEADKDPKLAVAVED